MMNDGNQFLILLDEKQRGADNTLDSECATPIRYKKISAFTEINGKSSSQRFCNLF